MLVTKKVSSFRHVLYRLLGQILIAVPLLCCSIGFGDDQLLKEPTTVEDNGGSKVTPDGVALPLGFRAHKMSIVVDPDGSSTRALLLIAQVAAHNGASSCVKYVLYQLQAVQSLSGKHEQVLVRDSASGTIPMQIGKSPDFSATDTITGIFLAGGSFLFDLERETETLGKWLASYTPMVDQVTSPSARCQIRRTMGPRQ